MIEPARSWHRQRWTSMPAYSRFRPTTLCCTLALALPMLACDEPEGDTPPPECTADGVSTQGFSFDAGELIDPNAAIIELDFQASCTVDTIGPSAVSVNTNFSCDDAGVVRPISIVTPLEPAGPPPWAVGDTVQVRLTDYHEDVGRESQTVEVRAGDGRLLFAGIDRENVPDTSIAPLTVTSDAMLCAPPDSTYDDTVRVALTFALAGESIRLIDGQVGELNDPDSGHYSIHVATAIAGNFGEESGWNYLLIQHVD